MQLKYIDVDMSLLAPGENNEARDRLAALAEDNKTRLSQNKLELDRAKLQSDMYNKAADRQIKLEDIKSKERIAKMNKNKYDK